MRPIKAAYGGRAHSTPLVTYGLIGLNVVMFLVTTASGTDVLSGRVQSGLFQDLALAQSGYAVQTEFEVLVHEGGVAQGDYYRLLTSMFLHFGIVHLALNMYLLHLLGPRLEQNFGRLRFAALYLGSGLAGSALSYALGPAYGLSAGASGAVFGLFGASYVLQRRRELDLDQITSMVVINLVASFVLPFVDWRGHVGGLIGGSLIGAALVYAPPGRHRGLAQAIGVVGVLVLTGAIIGLRTAALTA